MDRRVNVPLKLKAVMRKIDADSGLDVEGWTRMIPAGRLPLPEGGQDIAILWQQWREHYEAGEYEPGYGRLSASGDRECVNARACYWRPCRADSVLRAAFGAVYEVLCDGTPNGLMRRDIATLYAAYYPVTRVLCMGEVAVFSIFLKENPEGRRLVGGLWDAFERSLLAAFPATETICTRGGSQDYYDGFYRRLLTERGYAPGAAHSYRKVAPPRPELIL